MGRIGGAGARLSKEEKTIIHWRGSK